jgi:hypothetical protein
MVEDQVRKAVEKREQEIELPQLTLEDKWEVARGNIIYFVVCGITYAKSKDGSPEEFGTHAGNVAAPFWRTGVGGLRMRTKEEVGEALAYFVEGISENYQQFKDFQMEILSQEATAVKVRMKNFGEDVIRGESGVTVDEYFRFFEKKWEAIANSLGLEYKQDTKGDWTYFTVTKKQSTASP